MDCIEYIKALQELTEGIDDREVLDQLALGIYTVGNQLGWEVELISGDDGWFAVIYSDDRDFFEEDS